MIGPLNVLLVILFLIIVPFILGLLLERIFEASGSTLMFSRCLLCGFELMLALFQLVAVPMIKKNATFDSLLRVYVGILVALIVISFIVNIMTIKDRVLKSVNRIIASVKEMSLEQSIIGIMAILVIAFETSLLIFKMHTDADDCRFLAEALDAVERNSLLRIHPIKGLDISGPAGEMIKDAISPYPIWIGAMAKLTCIHPTILAHSVYPVLLIPLCYLAAYLFGTFIFEEKKYSLTYILVLSVIILFSFESIYSWGYTLLSIIWQGRSIYAVVLLPFIWYLLATVHTSEEVRIGYFVTLLVSTLASACLSGMGVIMTPVLYGIFMLLDLTRNKRILPAVGILLCIIPNAIYIVLSYRIDWLIQ